LSLPFFIFLAVPSTATPPHPRVILPCLSVTL
jgi:hypothetical protein